VIIPVEDLAIAPALVLPAAIESPTEGGCGLAVLSCRA
jgi:hypothetical protein